MKLSVFLLVVALASFVFGALLFFVPSLAGLLLGIGTAPEAASLLRGMGGLVIGSGVMNLLARNNPHSETLRAILVTNIITHAFGLAADVWGVFDGALQIAKMAPVETTHLFCGVGSLIYWRGLQAVAC